MRAGALVAPVLRGADKCEVRLTKIARSPCISISAKTTAVGSGCPALAGSRVSAPGRRWPGLRCCDLLKRLFRTGKTNGEQAEKKGRPIALAVPAKMDIRTVAQLANTSIATVSRTVNRVSTVNPKLAKRVWAAIAQLDYFSNSQARALVSGRSRLLGLIVSDITNPFFPELIQGFEEIAVEHGYEILIGSTNDDSRRVSLCIRRMLERRAEGVAVLTFG